MSPGTFDRLPKHTRIALLGLADMCEAHFYGSVHYEAVIDAALNVLREFGLPTPDREEELA